MAGEALAAIIAAGITLYTGYMENDALEDASRESEYWANLARQDKLAVDAANMKLNKWNMRLKEKELAWKKSETAKDRKERAEERAFSRRENQWGKLLGIANQNEQIKDSLLAYFPKMQLAA